MHRSPVGYTAALIALVTLVGCSSSNDTGPSQTTLTSTEAPQVAAAIFTELSTALSNLQFDAPPVHIAAREGQPTATFSGHCAAGGTISGSLTYTSTSNSEGGSINESGSWQMDGCVVSTGSRNLSVDGNMQLTATDTYTTTSSQFSYNMSGSLSWSGGSCSLNYTVAASYSNSGGTYSYHYSGSICGQEFSYSS